VLYSRIQEVAWKSGSTLLKQLVLFDVYEGKGIPEGKKSYAVSFILQDSEKTLREEDIDLVMNNLIKVFGEELGASLR
jgi:phenylalanyl-tRNA synthetase beta chain